MDVRPLITKRSQIKSHITRFKNFVDNIDNSQLNPSIITQLECRFQKFEPLWEEFDNVQSEIELAQKADSADDNERETFDNSYYELLAKVKNLISKHANVSKCDTQKTPENHGNSNIRLPTINLPNFSGSYHNWLEFYDAFNALIHANQDLTDIQKFCYLRSSLKGDAAQVLQSLEVSAANYSIAWNLLRERYENKRLITQNHVKALFELPTIQRESHIGLRSLSDNVLKHLRSLKALGQPTDQWDTLIIYMITTKFDPVTRREWESFKIKTDLPNMNDMTAFLKNKCELLENLETNKGQINKFSKREHVQMITYASTINVTCSFCKNSHAIYNCESFMKLPVDSRINKARELKLCLNCLRKGHYTRDCKSMLCKKCNRRHNTLLHIEHQQNLENDAGQKTQSQNTNEVSIDLKNSIGPQTVVSNHVINNELSQILLSTAYVQIQDAFGKIHVCRALLDSGSQSNFITEELCQQLGLHKSKINYTITGINQVNSNINYQTQLTIQSRHNAFTVTLSCLVLPKITEQLPSTSFNASVLAIPANIKLADPSFNKMDKIDILIGADVFWNLLCVGQIQLGKNLPVLHKTKLGWIIAGNFNPSGTRSKNSLNCFSVQSNSLEDQVARFWQIEECNNSQPKYSSEEKQCENHFVETVKQNETGRFIVSIPFKDNVSKLGDSRATAERRFYSLEKRLERNPSLKAEYIKFMEEYETMNHMTKTVENQPCSETSYYLPHHAVVRETSLTTKVRVVFDGSAKSSTGLSLNETQMVGPTIQNDLFSIVLRFRKHVYVITADIAKMYRQVLIREDQRRYQKILWRSDPKENLQCFKLNTVTYGTASAPFLAIRCLYELAIQHEEKYPVTSNVIKNDFYVDDLLTGADSLEDLKQIQIELITILSSAGFELRKWLSNESTIFNNDDDRNATFFRICENQETKTLGIIWNPRFDLIQFSIKNFDNQCKITKRTILATVSQIFDPLGLLAPVTIIGKLIIQSLWQIKLSWDESIPTVLHTKWIKFRDQLKYLNDLKIPRMVLSKNVKTIELHGFSDASEKAYGACIYIRSVENAGSYSVHLLCAKSKVAPLHNTTLPRLELCAAVLLSHLCHKVQQSININFDKVFFWCDSTITLSWIKASPNRWKTFVANRVADIQNLTDINNWYHVNSSTNPADIISRGANPNDLVNSKLWWEGPDWLSQDKSYWPSQSHEKYETSLQNVPEERRITATTLLISENLDLFKKYSSLFKLQKVIAYCLRFITNSKTFPENRNSGPINPSELQGALQRLIKIAQNHTYKAEITSLTNERMVNSKSNLISLSPFLDDQGIIRVGGRLKHATYNYDKKHPIILPPKHPLTNLIMRDEHLRLLHCGPQLLLASCRERYWPISGRNLAKSIVRKCITCFRVNPSNVEYHMGDLPKSRFTQDVFSNVGVDYAGPFLIKDRKTRNAKLTKSYVCLFVCFATKAIHLELVSDLTSDSFLATLKRFIARRGKPQNMYSDNATNFVGAHVKIKELTQFLGLEIRQSNVKNFLLKESIAWHFIPAKSPHFGGLWEAGIKSTKSHLKRVLGNARLTFEDFYTVLTQIEAVLNSRPICPLSSDPNDLNPLTPGHFLIGKSLTALPEPNLINVSENRLSKFQRLQALTQHFWARWSKEYISELQTRVKWKEHSSTYLKPGALVLVREDHLPPLKWQLGRITHLHPGPDGIVRVATIKFTNAVTKRAVAKLCALPLDSHEH